MGVKKRKGCVLLQVNVPEELHSDLQIDKIDKVKEMRKNEEVGDVNLGDLLVELAVKGKEYKDLENG